MLLKNGGSLGGAIYIIVGIIVAATHGYFTALGSVSSLLSALLAVLLWPALLFGANFHLTFSSGTEAGSLAQEWLRQW